MDIALKDLIEKGVVADVAEAEQAHTVLKIIGQHAEAINHSMKNYRQVFSYIQQRSQDAVVLAVTRIFDKPSSRYPTRCFLGLVKHLEDNVASLPAIRNKKQLFDSMAYAGFESGRLRQLHDASDEAILEAIASSHPETPLFRMVAFSHTASTPTPRATGPRL